MNLARIPLLAVALLALPLALPAQEPARYFGGEGLYLSPDSARDADFGSGGRLWVGVPLSRVNLELSGFGYRTERQTAGRDSAIGFGLDAVLPFGHDAVRPFVLAGGGYLGEQVRGLREGGAFANLGAGVLLRMRRNLELRAEARYLGVFNDVGARGEDPLYDLHVGLGLQLAMESDAAPPAPPPPPDDADADGVPNTVDRCPGTAAGTRIDAFGCARDTDGDGVGDAQDRCPGTRRGLAVDAGGCPRTQDADGDGVRDDADRCPGSAAGARVDAAGCAGDADRDGVADELDRCPESLAGTRVGADGCVRDAQTVVLHNIAFKFDSHNLTPESETALRKLVPSLRAERTLRVEIAGHTDAVGGDDYNRALSQRRAESVMAFLVSQGLDAVRVQARGYGESEPVADNKTREGRARNRRVELRLQPR